jgi:Protein of unknown function (DUF3303)
MLFMVVEHFKGGNSKLVGERFRQAGRIMPDGVVYHASWIEDKPSANRCFQVMEAPDRELLNVWISCWNDLMDFEIIPVLASRDYWAKVTE